MASVGRDWRPWRLDVLWWDYLMLRLYGNGRLRAMRKACRMHFLHKRIFLDPDEPGGP